MTGSVPTSIIVHERIAIWTEKLRPRFASDHRVRWVESRSRADLISAVAAVGLDRAIVLVDLGGRTLWGLEGLDALNEMSHNAWSLVLDPDLIPEVPVLARELGATLVLSGVTVPPRVETLLHRWLNPGVATTTQPVKTRLNRP